MKKSKVNDKISFANTKTEFVLHIDDDENNAHAYLMG